MIWLKYDSCQYISALENTGRSVLGDVQRTTKQHLLDKFAFRGAAFLSTQAGWANLSNPGSGIHSGLGYQVYRISIEILKAYRSIG
jgi:hypothetical protein